MPNLVTLIMQFLTPDMLTRIASVLGLDRGAAQTGIAGAIPSLLAAFSGVASQPGGPQKLADAAMQQRDTLGGFSNVLAGGNQSSFIQQGTQMVSSLLGTRDQNALTGAIGKFAGMGQGATGSLIGMLAPLVMGMIAKQQGPAQNFDPSKIASLLSGQKDNIAAALPSGLGSLLGGTGLLDSLGGAARTATATTSEWASASTRAANDTGRRVASTARSQAPNWLYWLVPAAAIAALLAYIFGRPAEVAQETVPTRSTIATDTQHPAINTADVNRQVSDNLNNLNSTLGGITDAASAQAALPKLHEAADGIDKVNGMAAQLSPEQRKSIAGVVNSLMPSLNQLFNKVLAIPGVPDDVKPTVDALKSKIQTLAA
jgi:hypothetical protein